jgi:hypothetical protein
MKTSHKRSFSKTLRRATLACSALGASSFCKTSRRATLASSARGVRKHVPRSRFEVLGVPSFQFRRTSPVVQPSSSTDCPFPLPHGAFPIGQCLRCWAAILADRLLYPKLYPPTELWHLHTHTPSPPFPTSSSSPRLFYPIYVDRDQLYTPFLHTIADPLSLP